MTSDLYMKILNKLSVGSTHVRRFDNNSLLNNGKYLCIYRLVLHTHTNCSAPRGPDPLTHGQAGGAGYDPEGAEEEDEEQEYNFNDKDEEEDDRRKEPEDRAGKRRKVQEESEDEDD